MSFLATIDVPYEEGLDWSASFIISLGGHDTCTQSTYWGAGRVTLQERPWLYVANAAVALHLALYSAVCVMGEVCGGRLGWVGVIKDQKTWQTEEE